MIIFKLDNPSLKSPHHIDWHLQCILVANKFTVNKLLLQADKLVPQKHQEEPSTASLL